LLVTAWPNNDKKMARLPYWSSRLQRDKTAGRFIQEDEPEKLVKTS
jgi:hypothetical protein